MNAIPDPLLGTHALSPRQQAHLGYGRLFRETPADQHVAIMRELCKVDLFFLLVKVLNRKDMDRDWLFARCREVRASPNGHIDIWFREAGKSSIITLALTLQDILNNPEITVGIFSRSRPQAKAFMRQIKMECENNQVLKDLFPDVLWRDPTKDAPTWSLDDGLIFRRKGNPKEATVEAWGLIDGQPVGKHFRIMVYDDVIDQSAVTSPEMIEQVTSAWELSLSLGTDGGARRYIGTFYSHADTYTKIIERGHAKPRIYPATDNGEEDGKSVLLSEETLRERRLATSAYNFSCQYLCSPTKGVSKRFMREWIREWNKESIRGMNVYMVVDAANAKKKRSDYTAMWVIGLGRDKNYYVIDGVRDRLDLGQRTAMLFKLVSMYEPIRIGYEQYGMQADIAHIKEQQERYNFHFELTQLGGNIGKSDRIEWLMPLFKAHRIYLPYRLMYETVEGERVDLVAAFINKEYLEYPVPSHDDMLDAMSRIVDPGFKTEWPTGAGAAPVIAGRMGQAMTDYDPLRHQ